MMGSDSYADGYAEMERDITRSRRTAETIRRQLALRERRWPHPSAWENGARDAMRAALRQDANASRSRLPRKAAIIAAGLLLFAACYAAVYLRYADANELHRAPAPTVRHP